MPTGRINSTLESYKLLCIFAIAKLAKKNNGKYDISEGNPGKKGFMNKHIYTKKPNEMNKCESKNWRTQAH